MNLAVVVLERSTIRKDVLKYCQASPDVEDRLDRHFDRKLVGWWYAYGDSVFDPMIEEFWTIFVRDVEMLHIA